MRTATARAAKGLARRLSQVSMRVQDPFERDSTINMALYETNVGLPAVYRMLRQNGYSSTSALEKAYAAFLTHKPGGMGTQNEDIDPLLAELAEHGTSGGDTVSAGTQSTRTIDADAVIDGIERAISVGGQAWDLGERIYDTVTDNIPGSTPQRAVSSEEATRIMNAMQRYYGMRAAGGLRPYTPPAGGEGGGVAGGTSPVVIALGVAGAVLVGYALLGKKKKGK